MSAFWNLIHFCAPGVGYTTLGVLGVVLSLCVLFVVLAAGLSVWDRASLAWSDWRINRKTKANNTLLNVLSERETKINKEYDNVLMHVKRAYDSGDIYEMEETLEKILEGNEKRVAEVGSAHPASEYSGPESKVDYFIMPDGSKSN
jgi:hypothetical protein